MAFRDVLPHGELEEVFPDLFFVTGTVRPMFMGKQWQFSRNMTVVREGGSLTLVNTLRLDDAGLAKLDSLGKVEHVVKLGQAHGIDDAFYKDRYGAKQWALPGMTHFDESETDEELSADNLPFAAKLFSFDTSKLPEGLLIIEREGGIVISCDSLQNWTEVDEYFSETSAKDMTGFGFIKPANVGPGWVRSAEPQPEDFARLKQHSFKHLLPAHGKPLRDLAFDQFNATFSSVFGV